MRCIPRLSAKVGGKKNAVDQIDPDEMVNAVAALRELFHLRPTLAMISDEKGDFHASRYNGKWAGRPSDSRRGPC